MNHEEPEPETIISLRGKMIETGVTTYLPTIYLIAEAEDTITTAPRAIAEARRRSSLVADAARLIDESWTPKLRGLGMQHNVCDLPLATCTTVESIVGSEIPLIGPLFPWWLATSNPTFLKCQTQPARPPLRKRRWSPNVTFGIGTGYLRPRQVLYFLHNERPTTFAIFTRTPG